MDLASVGPLFDVVFIALLVAVLVYAVRLNRQIGVLQKNKQELEKLLAGFVNSTERAENAIERLKTDTGENSKALDSVIGRAETLQSDLSFMLDRGEEIANRLEKGIRNGRAVGGASASTKPKSENGAKQEAEAPSSEGAEQDDQASRLKAKSKADLLKALQGMR